MSLTMGEKIKIIMGRRNITVTALAELLGTTRQNLTNKFTRDNFSEKELHDIAEKLDCDFLGQFQMRDSKEKI